MAEKIPYLNMGAELKVNAVHRSEFDMPSPMSITGGSYRYQHAQGGCVAKGYVYTCMITDGSVQPSRCCIFRHDPASGKLVGHSEEMELGHANDCAYNPDENTIVVSLCDGTTRMAILDADTLALLKIVELEGHVLCNIAYDPGKKIYAASAVQNEMIYIYDKDFKLIRRFPGFMSREESGEYSMQGAITDGVYFYVLEWHGGHRWPKENITIESEVHTHFLVWEIETGKFAGTVELGIRREVEYAGYLDGKFWMGANNIRWNGMELYEVEITEA